MFEGHIANGRLCILNLYIISLLTIFNLLEKLNTKCHKKNKKTAAVKKKKKLKVVQYSRWVKTVLNKISLVQE